MSEPWTKPLPGPRLPSKRLGHGGPRRSWPFEPELLSLLLYGSGKGRALTLSLSPRGNSCRPPVGHIDRLSPLELQKEELEVFAPSPGESPSPVLCVTKTTKNESPG